MLARSRSNSDGFATLLFKHAEWALKCGQVEVSRWIVNSARVAQVCHDRVIL